VPLPTPRPLHPAAVQRRRNGAHAGESLAPANVQGCAGGSADRLVPGPPDAAQSRNRPPKSREGGSSATPFGDGAVLLRGAPPGYFARFHTATAVPPPEKAGTVYLSSSPTSSKLRF
jgi:hypothetical protein